MRQRRVNLGIFLQPQYPCNKPWDDVQWKNWPKKKSEWEEREWNRQMDRRVANKSKETKEKEIMYKERNNTSTRRIVRSTVTFMLYYCRFALGAYNKMYDTSVSKAHPHFPFSCCSFPALLFFRTLSFSVPPVSLPCPLDTSGVKLEQLHLQHKGLFVTRLPKLKHTLYNQHFVTPYYHL